MNQRDVRIAGLAIDAQVQAASVERAPVIDAYEAKLAKARLWALVVGALQGVCRLLVICNLIWATVVLLGAFGSSLFPADFRTITALLLLEAGRLASAILFNRLVISKAQVRLSQNPPRLKLEDHQLSLARALRVLSQIGQTIVIFPNFVLPIIRLRVVHSDAPNLLLSLKIFYILALINAAIGLAAVLCSIVCLIQLFDKTEQSIQRYYDDILRRARDHANLQEDEFEFFDFAFKLLGKEFARNVQAATVKKHHRQLLDYIYAHRHGVEFLQIYLDWENAFVQQAAACVVGFWAADKEKLVYQRLPKSLLTKLADKLGPGQVGWAAVDSFGALAKLDARVVLESTRSDKTTVLASLMEMVDPTLRRSLVCVRVLINLVSVSKDTMRENSKLVENLQTMLREAHLHRLRVLAGYLLFKMEMLTNIEACSSLIEAIDPTQDAYIHNQELNMLNELRYQANLPQLEKDAFIRKAHGKGKKFSVKQDLWKIT